MTTTPELPAGLTTRPLRTTDATAVHQLMAAQELADIGEVAIEEADIVSDWAKPSHDLGARSIGVWDGDTLVAYAELMGADRADTSVLPSHRGRGIGTWLAHWLQDLGRRVGSSVIGMPVPQGSPGDRLLEELGFRVRWTSWVLKLPAGATIPERELPEGYVVRTAEPHELRAAHDVLEDAFLEWSVREREPYEDFEAATSGRPGFEPWNLRVAVDGGGQVVGVSLVLVSDNGATAASPRPCWSTPSPRPARTAPRPPSSAPTRGRARSACTKGWGWWRRASGSIGRSTSPRPRKPQNDFSTTKDSVKQPGLDSLFVRQKFPMSVPLNGISIKRRRSGGATARAWGPCLRICGGLTCKNYMHWSSRTIRTSRQRWWRPWKGRASASPRRPTGARRSARRQPIRPTSSRST